MTAYWSMLSLFMMRWFMLSAALLSAFALGAWSYRRKAERLTAHSPALLKMLARLTDVCLLAEFTDSPHLVKSSLIEEAAQIVRDAGGTLETDVFPPFDPGKVR